MKRLLVFAAVAGMTASLFADRSFISGSGFENLDEGAINLPNKPEQGFFWWKAFSDVSNTSDITKIAAYADGEAKPDSVEGDDYFPADTNGFYRTSDENTKYLALDTGATVVGRTVTNSSDGRLVGEEGMYVDTMVQFTASDTPPEVSTQQNKEDQILVWLYANPDTPGVTNIVITAGTHETVIVDGNQILESGYNHYLVSADDVSVAENEWHRLTIVAALSNELGTPMSYFKVYIDDKQVSGTDSDENTLSTFWSICYGAKSLRAVCFAGQGSVDDIVVGTDTPFPPTEITYTITPSEGVALFTYQVDGGDVVTVDPAREVVLTDVSLLGKSIVVTPRYKENWKGELSIEVEKITDGGSLDIEAYTSVFTVTINSEDTPCTSLEEVMTAIESVESATIVITLNANYEFGEGEYLYDYNGNDITLDLHGKTLQALSANDSIIYVSEGTSSFCLMDSVGGGVLKFADDVEPDGTALIVNQVDLTIGVQGDIKVFTLANGAVMNDGGTLKIYGGQFAALPVDADGNALADDDLTAICQTGYTLKSNGDYYVLTRSGDSSGDITIDSFECDFTVDTDTAAAITEATGVGTTEDNFAKAAIAYVVGGSLEDGEVVIPTPTITVDGTTVTVTYDSEGAHATGYTVKCTLYAYDLATGTKTPVAEGTIGNGLEDKSASAASKFYVVGVTVEDAQ